MDMQDVWKLAKDTLLEKGEHPPVMYIEYVTSEGKEAIEMYFFAQFGADTALEEHKQFFNLGATFGAMRGRVDFTRLTFITESWVSLVQPSQALEFQRLYQRPHNDPNRKEYLIAQIVEIMPTPGGKKQMQQSLKRAEILRSARCGAIDLRQEDTGEIHIARLLFPAYFLSGYASTQIPEAELREIVKSVYGGKP